MRLRTFLIYSVQLTASVLAVGKAVAQDSPGKRLASVVAVAVEEYRLGVNASGAVISQMELDEARAFLADAREIAAGLSGEHASSVRALLDSLVDAAARRVPPASMDSFHQRLLALLGPDAALDLPSRPIDLGRGRMLYVQHCGQCHGVTGLGDGPAAAGLDPPPPPFADTAMRGVTPALMYRVVSVGVQGTAMAPWASVLSSDERWDVVAYVNSLRSEHKVVARGAAALAARCPECARRRVLTDFGWLADRTDLQLAETLRRGDSALAIPALDPLDDEDAFAVVAYLRDAAGARITLAAASLAPRESGRLVLAMLDSALAAAAAGRTREAGDRAFDAYLAFEPLENRARARHPGLVAGLEREFLAFRGAVRAGDERSAHEALARIRAGLDDVVRVSDNAVRGWAAFAQSVIIILREGLEAILVLGAIVALLVRTGHRERLREVWIGVGLALVASVATAVVLRTVLSALPASREVIEGVTMLAAVAVLFSVSYWLLSKVESRRWQAYIQSRVGKAVTRKGTFALAGVAFLVVYREGAETVLFYQALFAAGGPTILGPVAAGFVAGSAVLAAVLGLFKTFGLRLPLRPFFASTGVLLYAMAFVFLGNGLRELQEGGALPITPVSWGPVIDVLGVYPTVETLAGQGILLLLLAFACWQSLIAPRFSARRVSPADPVPSSVAPASRQRQTPRNPTQSSAPG